MVAGIDFANAKCIVEYGAGTGVFTWEILQKRSPDTIVIIFEMNEAFCRVLNEKYGDEPNVYIVNDSAATVAEQLQKYGLSHADYVVSGLPFASLPGEVSEEILRQTRKCLVQGGEFITFQYTLFKKELFEGFFDEIEISRREWRNIPPAYVLRCR